MGKLFSPKIGRPPQPLEGQGPLVRVTHLVSGSATPLCGSFSLRGTVSRDPASRFILPLTLPLLVRGPVHSSRRPQVSNYHTLAWAELTKPALQHRDEPLCFRVSCRGRRCFSAAGPVGAAAGCTAAHVSASLSSSSSSSSSAAAPPALPRFVVSATASSSLLFAGRRVVAVVQMG